MKVASEPVTREQPNLPPQGGLGSPKVTWVWLETGECLDVRSVPGRNLLSVLGVLRKLGFLFNIVHFLILRNVTMALSVF